MADLTQPSTARAAAVVRSLARKLLVVVAVAASATLSSWLLGTGLSAVSGNMKAPWILGRAAGVTSYLLLTLLVLLGLVLSHPWRARWRRPSTALRLRAHVSLAVFTLAFVALHVLVLATDTYAGVGWRGTLLPMGATYRPVAVTLGVVGLYAGLLAGLTAAAAGRRVANRVWWPVHKVAAGAFALVWLHGVLAGSDTPTLLVLYLATGGLVVALAVSRYVAHSPRDHVARLASARPSSVTTSGVVR